MKTRELVSNLFLIDRENVASPFFRAGEEIMVTGVYRVFHIDHRVSHEAILCAGEAFPRCNQCGEEVHFELLRSSPQLHHDRNFRSLKLYEIPHPAEEELEQGKELIEKAG